MWLLKDNNNGRLIYLKPNATMTVGRNKGDIVLSEDGSISRLHAEITVKSVLELDKITDKTQPLSDCIIKDTRSKYGNYIVKDGVATRIPEEGTYKLQNLDCIRFGLQNYIFTVHYIPIITATTGMSDSEKEKLKKVIDAIDGEIIYVWSPLCTHMTVQKPTISEKLTCALAAQIPIVPMDYWLAVTKAVKENTELPDAASFASSINNRMREIGQVSVIPNIARSTLFKNLKFVHFSSKQFGLYGRMIKLAGGTPVLCTNRRPNLDVCDENVIVVQFVESNTTQATGTGDRYYAEVCEKLSTRRRRAIPESEIAIAILHCSMEKYCNPKYDYAALFASRRTENETTDMTVLALDTQDVEIASTSTGDGVNKENAAAQRRTVASVITIPETVEESYEIESQSARKPKSSDKDCGPRTESRPSENVANISRTEDLLSESEIGSMKLASLNHENYLEEEYNRRASIKRNLDREAEESDERKKKRCLGISSVHKVKERDQGESSKLNQSYEEMMPDDEDDFFMDEELSIVEKVMEKNEGNEKFAGTLPAEKKVRDDAVDVSKRVRSTKTIDLSDDDDVSKTTSATTSSAIGKGSCRAETFGTEGRKLSDKSAADEGKRPTKRRVGRSDITPFSDITKKPHKPSEPEFSIEKQSHRKPQKTAMAQRALMEIPASPSKHPKEIAVKKENEWIESFSSKFSKSENDYSTISDDGKSSSGQNYDVSKFFKLPNDPNGTLLPLLRIQTPADIYNETGRKFGKCFRKQKISIPTRIELDSSIVYESSSSKEKTPKRDASSGDDDDDERPFASSRKQSVNSSRRANKIFRL